MCYCFTCVNHLTRGEDTFMHTYSYMEFQEINIAIPGYICSSASVSKARVFGGSSGYNVKHVHYIE